MQLKIFGFVRFITSQRGKGNLYSECDLITIYRSDAYAAATYWFAFYGFRRNLKMLNNLLVPLDLKLWEYLVVCNHFILLCRGLCSTRFNACERLYFCYILCSLCRGGYYPPDFKVCERLLFYAAFFVRTARFLITIIFYFCNNFGRQKPPSLRESGRVSGGRSKNPVL